MDAINEALWQQFGAALTMLDNAIVACPDDLWTAPLWTVPPEAEEAPFVSEFWALAGHSLRWLERYMLSAAEAEFSGLPTTRALPPTPEVRSKDEVREQLAILRSWCAETLRGLTDARLIEPVFYEWVHPDPITYFELQVYTLRHLQEHAAQLSLFLGQNGIPGDAVDWVSRAE